MKFILNEKFILSETSLLTEATLPEYKKKEEELKKTIEAKKTELDKTLKSISSVILEDASNKEIAQKRIDEFEKPCNELVYKIETFLTNLKNKNLDIPSTEAAEAVDNFIEVAKTPIFPGGIDKIIIENPDLKTGIDKAIENVATLTIELQKLSTSMSSIENKDSKAPAVPTDPFSSEWTNFMKNATDKTAAWEAYYRAWDKYKGGTGSSDGVVYKRIESLGTAFMQGLDKLGYTIANPFIVYLDRIIKDCPITWQTYNIIHNAYITYSIVKEWLLGTYKLLSKNIIDDPQWFKLDDLSLYQKYIKNQADICINAGQAASVSVDIDGLKIKSGMKLKDVISQVLYKDDKLRDIDMADQIIKVFNATGSTEKTMSKTDAEDILKDTWPGIKAEAAKDLAQMLIYDIAPEVDHAKLLADYKIGCTKDDILKFDNPKTLKTNYDKVKGYTNLGSQLDTILKALSSVINKGKE